MILLPRSILLALAIVGSWAGCAVGEDGITAALGRIAYQDNPADGEAICTGALVAPNLVLTAGHCVRGAAAHPQSIRFDLGWDDGGPTGRRRGAEVILSGEEGQAEDVALVRLNAHIPYQSVAPLPIRLPSALHFTLQAFRRDAPGQPAPPQQCRPRAIVDGLLGLDCPAVSGNSGAPLLERTTEGWVVVGVMVAASDSGPARSWAVLPPAWVRERVAGRVAGKAE